MEGNLKAPYIVVGGRLRGNVDASMKVELLSTAMVGGDIRAPKLVVSEGAMYEGNCEMIQPEKGIVEFKAIKTK